MTIKHTSVYSFRKWVEDAEPGERLSYYLGMLVSDRHFIDGDGVPLGNPVDDIGRAAYAAYRKGKVVLHQQRLAPDVYNYIAVKQ